LLGELFAIKQDGGLEGHEALTFVWSDGVSFQSYRSD
jgi:hypothetical protein